MTKDKNQNVFRHLALKKKKVSSILVETLDKAFKL